MGFWTSVLTFLGFLGLLALATTVEHYVTKRTWNKIVAFVHFPIVVVFGSIGVTQAIAKGDRVLAISAAVLIAITIVGYLWTLMKIRKATGSVFGTVIPTAPEYIESLELRMAVKYYQMECDNPVPDHTMIRLRRTQMFEALRKLEGRSFTWLR